MFFEDTVYLIGAETDYSNNKENLCATEELEELLYGLDPKSMIINLGNREEIVYAVRGEENVPFILSLSKRFDQTHYVVIYKDAEVYAVGSRDQRTRFLGILSKIKKPLDNSYWLHDILAKNYYGLRKIK